MDVPRYEYNAIDDYGKKVRGTLLAPDENGIRETLASMGLHVIQFTYHLKTLLGAGISIVVALGDLAEQTDHPALKEVIRDVRRNVQAGAGLSASFALHPEAFPESYVSIVRAGETTGNLEGV